MVGFDDTPTATTVWPELTTIRQPIAAMAGMIDDMEDGDANLLMRDGRDGKWSVYTDFSGYTDRLVGGLTSLLDTGVRGGFPLSEIALLYGRDIDDQARVSELMAVVAATGASVAAPYVVNAMDLTPLVTLPVAAITATAVRALSGEDRVQEIARMLRRTNLPVVLAVNKLDLVDYSQAVFQRIADDYQAFARRIGIEELTPIPESRRMVEVSVVEGELADRRDEQCACQDWMTAQGTERTGPEADVYADGDGTQYRADVEPHERGEAPGGAVHQDGQHEGA